MGSRLGAKAARVKVGPMQNLNDPFRRWLEMLCLSVSAGMLFWGYLVLRPYLHGWVFVGYWVACATLALGSSLLALHDAFRILSEMRRERARLNRKAQEQVGAGRVHRMNSQRNRVPPFERGKANPHS